MPEDLKGFILSLPRMKTLCTESSLPARKIPVSFQHKTSFEFNALCSPRGS